MKPLLAIDLGRLTGWRLRRGDGRCAGGTYDFSGSAARVGQKYHHFRRFLLRVGKEIEPDDLAAVVYELVQFAPKVGGLKAAQSWAGFEAILTQWCEYREVPYVGVPVATLKKSFTGRGNATKDDMVARARALGFRPTDDNEADAIALMDFYEVEHEGHARRVPGHEKVSLSAGLAL